MRVLCRTYRCTIVANTASANRYIHAGLRCTVNLQAYTSHCQFPAWFNRCGGASAGCIQAEQDVLLVHALTTPGATTVHASERSVGAQKGWVHQAMYMYWQGRPPMLAGGAAGMAAPDAIAAPCSCACVQASVAARPCLLVVAWTVPMGGRCFGRDRGSGRQGLCTRV